MGKGAARSQQRAYAAIREEALQKQAPIEEQGGNAWRPKSRAEIEASPTVQWAREHPDEALKAAAGYHDLAASRDDPLLVRILQDRGEYGKPPRVLTKSQINDLVGDGHGEFFHGFASAEGRNYAAQLMAGNFSPGRGAYGSGFYTGYGLAGRAEAHQYTGLSKTGEATPGSVVLRGSLLPNTRVYAADNINRDLSAARSAYQKAHPNMTPAEKAVFNVAYGDIGRYAALRGYDVVGKPGKDAWGLIVNPGAVAVQRSHENEYKSQGSMWRNNINWATGHALSQAHKAATAAGKKVTRAQEQEILTQTQLAFAQREASRVSAFRAAREKRQARSAARKTG